MLEQHQLLPKAETIVDETIIAAPSSTKNTTRVLTTFALAKVYVLRHKLALQRT